MNIMKIIDWTSKNQPTQGERYYFADTVCELAIAEEHELSYGVFSHRINNEYCMKDCRTGLPHCANYLLLKED